MIAKYKYMTRFPFHKISSWTLVTIVITFTILTLFSQANQEVWKDLPGETYLKFYLFNVTNPDEFEAGIAPDATVKVKPSLSQLGPFVFHEINRKVGLSTSDDESTVKFRQSKYYELVPELSKNEETGQLLSENDLVNIVNIPLLSFAKHLGEVPYIGPNMFRSLIKAKEKVIKRDIRVGDLFYYGYDASPYLKVIDILMPGEPVPPEFEDGRFGLFKERNGTDDGEFEIGTGTSSLHPYGHVFSWRGQQELSWWNDSVCNNLNKSILDGSSDFSRPDVGHYHLYVLLPDACRTVKYTFEEEVPYNPDITGLRYLFDKNLVKSSNEIDENSCYCVRPGENRKNCLRSGTFDISPCRKGAPLVLTYPHFLGADPYYLDQIQSGLNPDTDSHESFMIIEPRTGTLLKDAKRFQLNLRMKPLPSLSYLKSAPDMLFPVLWTEKVYSLSDEQELTKLNKELNTLASNDVILSWRDKETQTQSVQPQIDSRQDEIKTASSSSVEKRMASSDGESRSIQVTLNSALLLIISSPVLLILHNEMRY